MVEKNAGATAGPARWRWFPKAVVLLLATALLATAQAQAQTTSPDDHFTAPVGTPAESQPLVELTGSFHVVWGDGLPGSKAEVRRLYFLIDDQGRWTRLLIDEALVQHLPTPLTPDRRQAVVRGSAVALPPSARTSGTFPTLEVKAIDFLSVEEEKSVAEEKPAAQATAVLAGSKPWVTILCRFSDSTGVTPHPLDFFQQLMGSTTPGMDHYWREQSYDNINLNGSVVVGWYNLPQPASFYVPDPNGDPNFTALLNDCTAAADVDVHFPNFTGINLLFNGNIGCCSYGGGASLKRDGLTLTYAVTWMGPFAFNNQSIVAHEMGHGFGLPHSSGPYGVPYDSQWDVMSGGGKCSPSDPDFGCLGVHTVAYHKKTLGWIPPAQRFYAFPGGLQTINLERMAQPSNTDYLMARIPINGSVLNYYTVEARRFLGYDTQVPGEAILIHKVNTLLTDRISQVVDPDGNSNPNDSSARWTTGETFTDAANGISVTVNSTTTTGYNISIQPGPPAPLFFENAEGPTTGWSPSAPWARTTESSHSATHSWTDSPGGNYSNNIVQIHLRSPRLDVSPFTGMPLTLTFWHRYDFEEGADFGKVSVMNYDTQTLTPVASFTGTNTTWHQSTVDLSAFAGLTNGIAIYFTIVTNATVTRDGWYLDDISLELGSAPTITSISPTNTLVGGPQFTLTVNGSNFVSTSVVRWNGSDRTTTFVNSGQLTATIPASDIAAAGTATVTVFNPAPSPVTSGGQTFTINNPLPASTSISPTNTLAGGAQFTLTVNGSNFVGTSVVRWNGSNRTTTFVNSGQLTATIPAADIATAGTASVTVFNPTPGGGTSGGQTFTINNPAPATTSISPTNTLAGGAQFTLTVNGSNFVGTSVVRWNGSNRTTTFVNGGQVTATIPAADIATAGTASVTVFNPTPGGGTSGGQTFTINNPVPATTNTSPTNTLAGGAQFTLTVNGSNFVSTSVVRWNGSDRTTTFVNSGQLTATVPASDIAAAGTATVTVFNPAPSGGTSGGQTFTINNPAPATTNTSPTNTLAGGAQFTLTVNGSNFVSTSVVRWNGSNRTTTFVNSGQLTATIPASDIATAGTATVTVFNAAPGGGTSGGQTFTINNPVPATTSISPTNTLAGGAQFTLTVNGSNFAGTSVVRWNGSNRTTTFVNSGQLTATIPAADIATAGTASVTVFNPTPGGGTSGSQTFTINNPVPATTSISPTNTLAGGAQFTLTVNGSNFVSTSVVRWNGNNRATTFVNTGQVTATIPPTDIAAAGTATVTVFTPAPGGGTSSGQTFTINNPAPSTSSLSPTSAVATGPAFTLTVNGSNFLSNSVVRWNGADRTTTFVNSGQLTAAITVSDISSAGTATVTVFNPLPGGGASNGQIFTINPPPAINNGGVVNAASFAAGAAVAPGSIVATFGTNMATNPQLATAVPLPTTLGGATMQFTAGNTFPVPMLSAHPMQIGMQVPWELGGQASASLTDTVGGVTSAAVVVSLATYQPGLFSTNAQGFGQGTILIANTATLAAPVGAIPGRTSRPAVRGTDFLEIYWTGGGPVTNQPASGHAASANPLSLTTTTPSVTIGGVNAPVSFSGLAPGYVGLYVVTLKVPAGAPTGSAVPVVLTIGGVQSNTVTIAVQ